MNTRPSASPNTHSVAGRHAADRVRARAAIVQAEHDDQQDHARRELDRTLRGFGLRTEPHFDPSLGTERSIFVWCRVPTARSDHELIYAILDDQGWRSDCARLSRHRQAYDVLRLVHQQTGATLVVIVKVPFGAFVPLEAA